MRLGFFFKRYWKTTIWCLIMAYALFTPASKLPRFVFLKFPQSDKLIHISLFMLLEFLLLFETKLSVAELKSKRILLISTSAIIYGGLSEIIQLLFINGRSGSWFDFLADCVGIGLALLIYRSYVRLYN